MKGQTEEQRHENHSNVNQEGKGREWRQDEQMNETGKQ